MKKLLFVLGIFLAAQSLPAQSEGLQAPLFLFTSGAGKILLFHNGQVLDAGRRYQMIAVAAPGYMFAGWSPVYVATLHIVETNDNGGVFIVTTNVTSVHPISSTDFVLTFTMQPEEVVVDTPLVEITETIGWQANFVTRRQRK